MVKQIILSISNLHETYMKVELTNIFITLFSLKYNYTFVI